MVRKELIKIEGKWKSLGSIEKSRFTYVSGKDGKATCWQNGFAILCHSAVSGVFWSLTNLRCTALVTVKTSSDISQIDLAVDSTRFQVKCEGGGFVIIPKTKDGIEDLLADIKKTLLTLKRELASSGDELLTPEAALNSILSDDDMVLADDSMADGEADTDSYKTRSPVRNNSMSSCLEKIRKEHTPPSARHGLNNSFYRSSSAPQSKLGLTPIRKDLGVNRTSLTQLTGRTTSASEKKAKPTLSLNLVPRTGTTKDSLGCEAVVITSDSDDETLLTRKTLGFRNLGNSCYMNVIWQSLLSLDTFAAELLHSFDKYESSLKEISLLRCLSQLALYKREKRTSVSEQEGLLRKCIKAVAAVAAKYDDHRQHDAHEFFGDVVDLIKEEIALQEKDSQSSAKPAVNATVDNFQFELQTRLECSDCGHTTTKSETQNGLTVTIPQVYLGDPTTIANKRRTNVQDAVDTYFKSEAVDYLCDMCGCHTFHSYPSFKTVPRVLVVVAKRYDSKRLNRKMVRRLAINRHVTLANLCSSDVPTASAPTIPIKLLSPNIGPSHTPSQPTLDRFVSRGEKSRTSLSQAESSSPWLKAPTAKTRLFPDSKIKSFQLPSRSSEHKAVSSVKHRDRSSHSPGLMSPPLSRSKSLVKVASLSKTGHSAYEKDSVGNSTSAADKSMDDADEFFIQDDDDFAEAIEQSKRQAARDRKRKLDTDMTENEQMQLAMARSLEENQPQAPMYKVYSPKKTGRPLASIDSNEQRLSGLRGGSIISSDTDNPTPPKLKHSPIVGDLDVTGICNSGSNSPPGGSGLADVMDVSLLPTETIGVDKGKENMQPDIEGSEQAAQSPQILIRTADECKQLELHDKNGTELGYSYKLVGVVSHIGSSSAYGHYVNDVYNVRDNVWLSYDDHKVDVTDINGVCSRREENAYIFFYMDRMVLNDIK